MKAQRMNKKISVMALLAIVTLVAVVLPLTGEGEATTADAGYTYGGWSVVTSADIPVSLTPSADTYVAVTGITMMTKDSGTTIDVGDSLQLVATVMPEDASDQAVSWSSSNPFVASVDSMGVVAAHGAGRVTITVITHEGGYTATYVVSVSDRLITHTPPVSDNAWLWSFGLLVVMFGAIFVYALIKLYKLKGENGGRP